MTTEEKPNSEPDTGDEYLVGRESDVEPDLSVVLPTLNEEGGVRRCLPEIKAAVAEMELYTEILVSDSSTDRTPEIARELGAIVVEPDEMGYGNAYSYAFERARGDHVVMGDADTTYDFSELPELVGVARSSGADIVIGSRFEGTIEEGAMPFLHRRVGNPVLTRFLNAFYDAEVSDAHSGLRVLRRDALEELDLGAGGMEFATEMLVEATSREMRIEEVPISYRQRVGEPTLDTFGDGWRHVKFMLTNAPGYLFALPGLVFCLIGVVIAAASLATVQVGGVFFSLQTLIGGILFVIVGYQVGTLALYSSVAADPVRRPQDRITTAILERFTLESGATIGIVLFILGAGFLSGAVVVWLLEGIESVPAAQWNLVAATAIVIGTQTVFSSFFLSLLAQHSD